MTKMGVKSKYIIEEKTPYVANNLSKKYDKNTTAFVYVFGAKDAGRLGGSGKYYKDFLKNKKNLEGFEKHGYFLVAPHVSISVGGKEVSGTTMRELLGSDKYDDKQRAKLFKKMFGYYDKGVFNMMTNKFKKLFEQDIMHTTWDNTDEKPKNPKLFDKKKKDLLFDMTIDKLIKKLKIPQKLMKGNRQKIINYITSNPQIVTQMLRLATEEKLKEVKLPIKVGDTIMMGRFKNKKVVIKSIDFNEKGDLMINGRPALKFRIVKSKEIDEFLIHNNISKIFESSNTGVDGVQGVDSGPSLMFKNANHYKGRGNQEAEKLGWTVINYILQNDTDNLPPSEFELLDGWPLGPHNSVSYLPAGIGTGKTPNNQENLTGTEGYDKWVRAMRTKAQEVGYELMKFTKQDKDIRKQIAKDTVDTIKQQEKEEVEENVFTKDWWNDLLKEELLTEGGAYGHMAHPFDDKELTFGDLKKIIELGLGGQLNREDNVTEKLDGQNIMISFKDGKLIAARNKGHIKNGGKTALDKKGIASKFKGRGAIRNAFVYAMNDLEKAIKSLSDKQRDKIFNNGYNFMNLEVMYPSSANVIDYDVTELIFHGALKYDDKGNVIGEVPGSGRMLQGMIQQRNQNIQKKYSIGKPVFLDVPKHQDFGKMKGKFLGRLSKLQAEYGLKDNDTLGLYHQMWWEHKIYQTFGSRNLSGKLTQGLVKRWAFFDKSYSISDIKKDMERFRSANPKREDVLQAILDFDKTNHKQQVKKNMKPFEELFFEVGAEILKNVKGFISANPKKSVQGIVKRLDKAISIVKSSNDVKKLKTLKQQLDKLNAIGGTKAIVPSEGLVFKYKGKTYKFTGAFAPINQITGLIYF
jgi:hypothetical protein